MGGSQRGRIQVHRRSPLGHGDLSDGSDRFGRGRGGGDVLGRVRGRGRLEHGLGDLGFALFSAPTRRDGCALRGRAEDRLGDLRALRARRRGALDGRLLRGRRGRVRAAGAQRAGVVAAPRALEAVAAAGVQQGQRPPPDVAGVRVDVVVQEGERVFREAFVAGVNDLREGPVHCGAGVGQDGGEAEDGARGGARAGRARRRAGLAARRRLLAALLGGFGCRGFPRRMALSGEQGQRDGNARIKDKVLFANRRPVGGKEKHKYSVTFQLNTTVSLLIPLSGTPSSFIGIKRYRTGFCIYMHHLSLGRAKRGKVNLTLVKLIDTKTDSGAEAKPGS